jgi:UDP-N-acetylmuramoyl-tripeptide--D-alanyl-D-alanine ligase
MKNLIKKIIFTILKWEAKAVLLRHNPKIIAITGSVGKTTTKDAIYKALSKNLHVRKNNKSMNSEIGVPLAILGLETGWNDPFHWVKNIFIGFFQIIYHPHYPEWLVLEVGIDRPGDMKKTASWLKPDVAVITAFPNVPVHVEYFDSPEAVAKEKSQLIDFLKKDGVIILNADDENVLKLKSKAKHPVYTFGKDNLSADLIASNYSIIYGADFKPTGITFKVNHKGNTLPIKINGVIGEHLIYPALVSLSVGTSLGLDLISLSAGLSEFKSPAGRMNILEGKNGSVILDDTYNASPIAVQKAIESLASIETNGKKIAILGDMTEIGRFTAREHRHLGEMIKKLGIDILITAGVRSPLIGEEAIDRGMAKGRVMNFNSSVEIAEYFNSEKSSELLAAGNIFLVKGSQSTRMEKVTKEIMAHPENAKDLLVRQEKEWLER